MKVKVTSNVHDVCERAIKMYYMKQQENIVAFKNIKYKKIYKKI